MIYMNAEGTDPGSGVPGEQGFRGSAGAQFDVGGGEAAAGGQNEDALGAVMNAFRNATSSLTEDDYYAQLSEGVNWFAAIDTLDAGSQAALGRLGGAVQSRARGNVGEGQLFMNPNEVSDDHAREMLVERQAGLQSARTTMLGLLAQPLDPRKPDDMARLLAAAEALANA
jgi:hypothetical protein